MINVITNFGSSFKGLASYLLHDVEVDPVTGNHKHLDSSERVAWTETLGLATDDPHQAYKIMIATAKSQGELKDQAGVAKTGRKSHKHVMHYVLSWHPDERAELTRDDMVAAAKASMTYLGTYEGEKLGKGKTAKRTQFADEHQAVIVCHDDGPGENPHVHIMLNRVHPEHGVMLPDSKDFEKLSAWALDYRTAQGKEHYCEQRRINAAKKAQGIITNNPRKPRNVYEQEQAIADADPDSRKKALLEAQQRRAKELNTKAEAIKTTYIESIHALEAGHLAAEREVRDQTVKAMKAKTAAIRAAYAPRVDELTQRQADELTAFKDAKGTAAGHVRNTWAAFKTKQWMTEIRTSPLEAMKHSFTLAFSSGLQLRDIEKHHSREQSALRGERHRDELAGRLEARTDEGFKLDELRQQYHQERNDLILEHGMENAKLKAEWNQLTRDRLAAEIEDTRDPSPASDRQGTGEGGRGQVRSTDTTPTDEQQETPESRPVETWDIPIDELRRMAREARDAEIEGEQDHDQDQEHGR